MRRGQFAITYYFFFHTPSPPLPQGERGGSTPHPAVHVRERRDHSPRGEWYRARRTLWQVLEKLCVGAIPCYKGFAGAHAIFRLLSPTPSHMGGGTHRFGFSSYEDAAAAAEGCRNERSRKIPRNFPASFVCALSAPAACISLFYSCSRFAIVYD